MDRRHFLAGLGAATLPMAGHAQSGRTVRVIVPFAPGGPTDLTTRIITEKAAQTLGTPMVVDNRPGAGGGIGVDLVAKAAPDGHTIGLAAVAMHAINPWLFKKLPYDPIKDFAPITQMVRIPNVLVMNADTARRLKIATLKDFIAYARANPASLNYASGGNGSGGHLAGELFKRQVGFFAVHIPYNGGAPSQIALLSGTVDYTLDNLATSAANIRSGKLIPLAVTTPQRSPLLPEVPTMASVLPGFDMVNWWGLFVPAGTPQPIIGRLNTELVKIMRAPDVVDRFAGLGVEALSSTPDELTALVKAEITNFGRLIKAANIKAD
jgi:tripartite-type tricarboxylate transporter receptor subunit TctC